MPDYDKNPCGDFIKTCSNFFDWISKHNLFYWQAIYIFDVRSCLWFKLCLQLATYKIAFVFS